MTDTHQTLAQAEAATGPTFTFAELELHPLILDAISDAGYTSPTPIQREAIPLARKGRDIMGIAQTGSGKTAAFGLPILAGLAQLGAQIEQAKRGIERGGEQVREAA